MVIFLIYISAFLLCIGIDFREETEPQDHHALVGYVLFSYYFVYLLKNY